MNPIALFVKLFEWIVGLVFPNLAPRARLAKRVLAYFRRKGDFHIQAVEAFLDGEPGAAERLSPLDAVAILIERPRQPQGESNPDADSQFPTNAWLNRCGEDFYAQAGQVSWDLATMGYPGLSDSLLRAAERVAIENADHMVAASLRKELDRRQTNTIRQNPFIMYPS